MADDPNTESPIDGTPPIVLLHGFTQNRRCLGPLATRLERERRVLSKDLPGHGRAASKADSSLEEAADLVAAQVGAEAVDAHWFGYSMGGRVALRVALEHPGIVRSLVLLGATAGIRGEPERRARRALDERRAARVESSGVVDFCREWLDAPMFAGLPGWARFEAERGSNTVQGLAGSLRNAGTGSMQPMWDRLGELQVPVLLLSGGADTKFGGIAEEMADVIGANARCVRVPGAGHAAHLERPEVVTTLVEDFLAEVESDRAGTD